MKELENAIKTRRFKVGVIGLGYVGLPLAVEFAKGGFITTGFEVDPDKVKAIAKGVSYIGDITSGEVSALSKAGKLKASLDFSGLKKMDAVIVCVPTPLRKSKDPDVSYIVSSALQIKKYLRRKQVIILES